MLLQAADFLHLYRSGGVELQMGGADQWGNMTAGLELIRKEFGAGDGQDLAFALSYPLLTNESGSKFGKTAAGTSVWLDREKTSPFGFYQYWLDADDRDVGKYLRTFTLFDRATIEGLEADMAAHPETRVAQKAVAYDLTARVHGDDEARRAVRVSEAAFSREPIRDPELLAGLFDGDRPLRVHVRGPGRRRAPAGDRERPLRLQRRGPPGHCPGRAVDQRRPGRRPRGRRARARSTAATSWCGWARRRCGLAG